MVKCSLCSENLMSLNALKIHLRKTHVASDLTRYDCTEGCSKTFDTWKSLRQHYVKSHGSLESNNVPAKKLKVSTPVSTDLCNFDLEDAQKVNADVHDAKCFNADQFQESLFRSAEIFVAKLYQKSNLPRNFVQFIIDQTAELFCSGFVDILEEQVLQKFQTLQKETYSGLSSLSEISKMFTALKNPFENLLTEHKRIEYFKRCKYYVPPESYIISDNRLKLFHTKAGEVTKFVKVTGQFIPLRKVLKNFFELPGSMSETLNFIDSLKTQPNPNFIRNLIQCSVWQRKVCKFSSADIVIPLNFYFDEFEPNSPLGGHSEKLGAGYLQIPVLPPSCQSKLENILLALLFDADDRKSLEIGKISYNEECFKPLVTEFNYLESEGIVCVTPDHGTKQVYFVLCLVFGDNLGNHGINGFSECPTCNYPCMICKASKEEVWSMTFEKAVLIRTMEDYDTDVSLHDVSETGIKEASVFNQVTSFHITEDCAIDVMHDAAEGVCHYVMIPVLKHFVDAGFFDVDTLNSRIVVFDYGPGDKSNKPPCIPEDFYTKSKLKYTAAEMISFIRLFGVFVGDLVPKENQFWELYKLTRNILSIFQAKGLPNSIVTELSVLIEEHHALYIRLTGETLKPKFHNYEHSPRVFNRFGPFSHYSAIRGEAKHKMLKNYTDVITSRKNLPKSVAIKHQLMMCYRFVAQVPLTAYDFLPGPSETFAIEDHVLYSKFQNSLPKTLPQGAAVEWLSWVDFLGTLYEPNMVLLLGIEGQVTYSFGKIVDIIVQIKEPLFICKLLDNIGYNEHIGGYEVIESDRYVCKFAKDLLDPAPLYDFRTCNGERVVVLKYYV